MLLSVGFREQNTSYDQDAYDDGFVGQGNHPSHRPTEVEVDQVCEDEERYSGEDIGDYPCRGPVDLEPYDRGEEVGGADQSEECYDAVHHGAWWLDVCPGVPHPLNPADELREDSAVEIEHEANGEEEQAEVHNTKGITLKLFAET